MTPKEHLELVIRPNMREMLADLDDIRLAFNAIAAVDALAAQIYGGPSTTTRGRSPG